MSLRGRRVFVAAMLAAIVIATASGYLFATRRAQPPAPVLTVLTIETADGRKLSEEAFRGRFVLLNVWATWCPPCVKEMPELDRFHREFSPAGWQVVGLAIDGPTPVKEFLAKVKVGFAIGLAGFGGTELAQTLGNQSGGLPFTVLIDAKGRIRHRKMGATTYEELAKWAREAGGS